jgi:hypothetical protein
MNVVPLSLHSDFTSQQSAPRPFLAKSTFPQDAEVLIYKPAPSAMTSGRAHLHHWKLRFERRSPPYVEPLMGWTGSDDTLSQVELSFPSAESAVAYVRRQGLRYSVQGLCEQDQQSRPVSDNSAIAGKFSSIQRRRRLEWVERTLGPDTIRLGFGPGIDPTEIYANPHDVLQDSKLSPSRKRDVLRRWALDAYQIEIEHSKGRSLAEPSKLQEVIDALLDLEEPQITPKSFGYLDRRAG